MRRLALPLWVLGLSIIGFMTCAVGADHNRNPLVGTWHLVRYIDTPEGSVPIQAYGTEPIGLFIFTSDGHVSISIMRNPPDITAATADPDPEGLHSWLVLCVFRHVYRELRTRNLGYTCPWRQHTGVPLRSMGTR
jgi:Lipocalin-like domain